MLIICFYCGKLVRREVDIMDIFVDFFWYFLRYVDSNNENELFSKELVNRWYLVD